MTRGALISGSVPGVGRGEPCKLLSGLVGGLPSFYVQCRIPGPDYISFLINQQCASSFLYLGHDWLLGLLWPSAYLTLCFRFMSCKATGRDKWLSLGEVLGRVNIPKAGFEPCASLCLAPPGPTPGHFRPVPASEQRPRCHRCQPPQEVCGSGDVAHAGP